MHYLQSLTLRCECHRKLEVQLPKFRMEQSYDMHNILPKLGITTVFQHTANLTRLSDRTPLKVSEVSLVASSTSVLTNMSSSLLPK